MKTFVSALAAAAFVVGIAASADAQSNRRDRDGATGYGYRDGYRYRPDSYGYRPNRPCVVTKWTDWSLTKPVFECPDEDSGPANRPRR